MYSFVFLLGLFLELFYFFLFVVKVLLKNLMVVYYVLGVVFSVL